MNPLYDEPTIKALGFVVPNCGPTRSGTQGKGRSAENLPECSGLGMDCCAPIPRLLLVAPIIRCRAGDSAQILALSSSWTDLATKPISIVFGTIKPGSSRQVDSTLLSRIRVSVHAQCLHRCCQG